MNTADIIRKSLRIGLGALDLTKEKAKVIARDLEKRGEINAKEAERLANDLIVHGKKNGTRLQKIVQSEVTRALKAAGVATRSDLNRLKNSMKHKKK